MAMTGAELRAARQTLGLNALAFARLCHVDGRTVRYWEADDRAIPGPLIALVELLLACEPARARFVGGGR